MALCMLVKWSIPNSRDPRCVSVSTFTMQADAAPKEKKAKKRKKARRGLS